MMLPLIGLALGALLGALAARRRGGVTADLVQWALVWAMIGGVLGMVALIVWSRMAG